MLDKLQQQKKILEDQGYKVAYICIYGSQNYEMDTPNSDIDMKSVIIPSLDDLINETKPISTSIATEWGLCDLKDIRFYVDTLCKANPVYIETLYTKYYVSNLEFFAIRDLRKKIVTNMSLLFVRGALGQIRMKREALCHPYPSIADKVEKYGYDPKQLHHVARLAHLIDTFTGHNDPQFVPSPEIIAMLMNIKTEVMPVQEAIRLADYYVGCAQRMVENWNCTQDFSVKDKVKEIARRIVKKSIIDSIW